MKRLTIAILVCFGFFISPAQDSKSPSELSNLSDSYKRKYFDGASNKIDSLSGLSMFEATGYIRPQSLPATSPVFQMIEYIKYQVSLLDSSDLKRGHTFYIYPLKFSDSIFFRNKYFTKGGQILKIENTISIPHLNNKAIIYYANGEPFKIFWAFTKNPYLSIFTFYYFDGKNISDYRWEHFKNFSSFEYQRAVDLLKDFKKAIIR